MVYIKKNSENNAICGLSIAITNASTILFASGTFDRFSTANFVVEVVTKDSLGTVTARENMLITSRVGNQFNIGTRAYEPVPIDDNQLTNIQQALSFGTTNTTITQVISKSFLDDIQTELSSSQAIYNASSTGNDGYVITLPSITAYLDGQVFNFKADVGNVGPATLNVNGLGAIAIKKQQGTVALSNGDIVANGICSVIYNSTGPAFQIIPNTSSSVANLVNVNADYTVTSTDDTLLVNATSNITLGTQASGKKLNIKNTSIYNIWKYKTNMPVGLSSFCSSQANGKMYIFGGYPNRNDVYEYNPINNTWAVKTVMPTGRFHATASVVSGKIYVIGGNANGFVTNTNEEYDPVLNSWVTKAVMPTARHGLNSTVYNGKIYCLGSFYGSNANEEYNPALNSWATKAVMPTGLGYSYSITTTGGYIHCIGGGVTDTIVYNLNQRYNPLTNIWDIRAAMPTARQLVVNILVGNSIYCIGGMILPSNHIVTVEIYNIINNTWSNGPNLLSSLGYNQGGEYINGTLYVLGGGNQTINLTPVTINLLGTIDGIVNKAIPTANESIEIVSDGTNWKILNKYL